MKEIAGSDNDLGLLFEEKTTARHFPIQGLGFGLTGIEHKTAALVQQLLLEYGPTPSHVRSYTELVYGCLTDMGWEAALVDAVDCIEYVIEALIGKPHDERKPVDHSSFIFPNALPIPDVNHLINYLSGMFIKDVTFGPEWIRLARVLCTWLRDKSHRQRMIFILITRGDPERLAKHLLSFSKSLAKWRWETLHSASKKLSLLEHAFKVCFRTELFQHSKEKETLHTVAEVHGHNTFWVWNKNICAVSALMEVFRGRCIGCHCHSDQCLEYSRLHKIFLCPFKGRSGPF